MSEDRVPSPAVSRPIPGVPNSADAVTWELFNGIDTKTPRPGIKDQEMQWCHGWMPIGPSHLRILPGIGPPIFSIPDGRTIVWFDFGNIGDTPYAVILLSDGTIVAVNTDTGVDRLILPGGSIHVPNNRIGFSQWGSQYLIFTKDQMDGYWLWNGTSTFGSGTFGPIVNVTNGGSNYTSPPAVEVKTTGGGGGATFSTQIDAGAVSLINVTSPGSGFVNGDFAILHFSGGGSDTTAVANANIGAGGGVTGVFVTDPGHGWTSATHITASGGGGDGATFAPNIQNGAIISVTVLQPGHDYTSPPSFLVTDPGFGGVPGGTGTFFYATIGANGISSISMENGGSGYTSVPEVTIIGDGSGATAVAHVAGGIVTDVQVINPGQGYTRALVKFSGGNNAAEADATLMPFGISGTTVEVYQSRVWIANGGADAEFPPRGRLQWSAPENPVDFGNGGGALVGSDSFLRVGWHRLKQTNGFLYLIGDSSVNFIGEVNTQVVGATQGGLPGVLTTIFRNRNSDPQIGSPWPSSVQVFSRNILLANTQGIFVMYGGAVTKVSAPLDGIFSFSPTLYGRTVNFSSAVAQIFGIQVYMLLVPFLDLTTGETVNQLIMYDQHKFWTSAQDVQLTWIATQEINSMLAAWGTDGRNLFRLFRSPSTGFSKVLRSKLWAHPGYDFTKTAHRFYGILRDFEFDQPLLIEIDNESEANPFVISIDSGVPGNDVLGPYPVGQQGKMIGFTVSTTASSGNLISLRLREQDFMLNT